MQIALRTILPLFLIISAGFAAMYFRIFKKGDEKVLSSYIYYFALPALFLADISRTDFTAEVIRFIGYSVLPLSVLMIGFLLFMLLFRREIHSVTLLISSSIFGSSAFFGVPFIIFLFNDSYAEKLAVLAAAFIAMAGIIFSVSALELNRANEQKSKRSYQPKFNVIKRFIVNPLILSIITGLILSFAGIRLPQPVISSLHMLGSTTATVAIFMLGMALYGRKYRNLSKAFALSLLRIVLLPLIALILVRYAGLPKVESMVIVLMHSMPLAVSMLVLSERYEFEKETIATLIMLSSLTAAIYLNLWVFLLNAL